MNHTLLEMRNISHQFRNGEGVHSIDLSIEAGQVHALIGLNGAGKSTLMRMMVGMTEPDSGTVSVLGVPISEAGPDVWRQVGHMIESPLIYPELTVRQNLVISARLHDLARSSERKAVDSIMEELDLVRYANHRAADLSQGNRQRAGIASSLIHHPRLIILDEPSNALDPAGVILLRETLQRRVASGAGILVSSHHLDEVARLADRITVLNLGAVIGSLNPNGVDIERAFFSLVRNHTQVSA
jgi:ABC-2 type transport system ATP-binding protein